VAVTETELITRYTLGTSIDTFAPGHYARVFEARELRAEANQPTRTCAFKVMRPEHLNSTDGQPRWEAPAFPY